MRKRAAAHDARQSTLSLQLGIVFPRSETILDPKTRAEVVALLGRLLLDAARAKHEGEVHDDAS